MLISYLTLFCPFPFDYRSVWETCLGRIKGRTSKVLKVNIIYKNFQVRPGFELALSQQSQILTPYIYEIFSLNDSLKINNPENKDTLKTNSAELSPSITDPSAVLMVGVVE